MIFHLQGTIVMRIKHRLSSVILLSIIVTYIHQMYRPKHSFGKTILVDWTRSGYLSWLSKKYVL